MELGNTEHQDDFDLAFAAAALGEETPPADAPPADAPPADAPPADAPPADAPPAVDEEAKRLQEEAIAREQYTDEESASIKTMVEEFPEVAAAIKAELRVLHAKLENAYNAQLQTVVSQFYQQVAPALAEAQTAARSRFEATVFAAHPDARTILPEVDKWVASKPAFLQAAYNAILDAGTAEDTVTLLNLFKQEMKPAAPAPKEGGDKQAVDPVKERKLDAQEGIRGRQTSKTGGIDEDDFESAFAAAATAK